MIMMITTVFVVEMPISDWNCANAWAIESIFEGEMAVGRKFLFWKASEWHTEKLQTLAVHDSNDQWCWSSSRIAYKLGHIKSNSCDGGNDTGVAANTSDTVVTLEKVRNKGRKNTN